MESRKENLVIAAYAPQTSASSSAGESLKFS